MFNVFWVDQGKCITGLCYISLIKNKTNLYLFKNCTIIQQQCCDFLFSRLQTAGIHTQEKGVFIHKNLFSFKYISSNQYLTDKFCSRSCKMTE